MSWRPDRGRLRYSRAGHVESAASHGSVTNKPAQLKAPVRNGGVFTCSVYPWALTLPPELPQENTVSKAREFVDFWTENSIHAVEQYRTAGASQDVAELRRSLVDAAKGQGVSEADLQAEIGEISNYIAERLKAVNRAERERRKSSK